MADQQRGRGRARGRARGGGGEPGGQRPGGQRPGGHPQQQQQPFRGPPGIPPPSVWGQPRQAPPQQQPAAQPMSLGRATQRGGAVDVPGPSSSETGSGNGSGNGNGGNGAVRRGAVRGRRQLHEGVLKTRPAGLPTKLGSHGTPIRLSANYFKLIQKTDWCLYQYRVDMAPEEDRTAVKKALFRIAVKDILAGYIFDGTVLFTSNRLNPDPMELFVQDERTGTNYKFTIRIAGDLASGDYQYFQFFNIIMRKCLGHLKMQLVGRNFFDAVAKISVPEHKMELWPGYITSIRQHEQSILMCVEVTHKVMRNDTVLNLLTECLQEDRSNFQKLFRSRVIGAVVLTDYNNRTYRIDDVDFRTSPSSSFSKRDGSSITYAEYFKQKYNLNIRDMTQPMLVSRAKTREIRAGMAEQVYLVPELCRQTGLTDAQRSNFQLMRALADHTRMPPGPRTQRLLHFSHRLRNNPQIVDELRRWDWELTDRLLEFAGRVLPPETLLGGGGAQYSAGREADWTKELRSKPMFRMVDLTRWAVVCPGRLKASAQSFVQVLQKAAKGMQWNMSFPTLTEIRDDRPGSYLDGLEQALRGDRPPQLVMCMATNNKQDRYSAIKKKCTVDRGIPSQVVLAKNLESKGVMSIATKVAIQLNCKLGGAPWSMNLPVKTTMIVGFDVCHDTNMKEKSYGAMVAIISPNLDCYFSTVTAHTSGEELSKDLALNMIKACLEWRNKHGQLPERILFYRDGVGEGQLNSVYQIEVEAVKDKLAELYKSEKKEVKLAYIIVSKRINTRIFNGKDNPMPGTVVDDVITLPERYDFFIVSQCVRQGTVSPTSYNVIYDTLGMDADKLQRLTYKMTHMYFNWSGTVRVPAPCQYAHKLAFMVAQYLHRDPNPALQNQLHFL